MCCELRRFTIHTSGFSAAWTPIDHHRIAFLGGALRILRILGTLGERGDGSEGVGTYLELSKGIGQTCGITSNLDVDLAELREGCRDSPLQLVIRSCLDKTVRCK